MLTLETLTLELFENLPAYINKSNGEELFIPRENREKIAKNLARKILEKFPTKKIKKEKAMPKATKPAAKKKAAAKPKNKK